MIKRRRVFGRVKKQCGDSIYKFELTPYGLYVRRRYSRVAWNVSFNDLVFAATGQRILDMDMNAALPL